MNLENSILIHFMFTGLLMTWRQHIEWLAYTIYICINTSCDHCTVKKHLKAHFSHCICVTDHCMNLYPTCPTFFSSTFWWLCSTVLWGSEFTLFETLEKVTIFCMFRWHTSYLFFFYEVLVHMFCPFSPLFTLFNKLQCSILIFLFYI